LVPDVGSDRRLQSRFLHGLVQPLDPSGSLSTGLADRKLAAVNVADQARRDQIGGRIQYATDGTLRAEQFHLPAARVDRFERCAVQHASLAVGVPVRDTVHSVTIAVCGPSRGTIESTAAGTQCAFHAIKT